MQHFYFEQGLSGGRILGPTTVQIDDRGEICSLSPSAYSAMEATAKFVASGIVNAHSHAFQRALAGRAEKTNSAQDDFWGWREGMYHLAERLDPDTLYAVASQVFAEMLCAGYTQVCEFHYVHNQPNGEPYADPASMSLALLQAAREVGIGITLLPVLYQTGGFDARPLSARQRRFELSVAAYLRLLETLANACAIDPLARVGVAFHSLRAVPLEAMREVLDALPALEMAYARDGEQRRWPVHIHISEQMSEVDECVALRGLPPVHWLSEQTNLNDGRWNLVHATHLNERELALLTAENAPCVVLCPTTEANLGDGIFPAQKFLQLGGRFAIGSDSQISVSVAEEIRLLDYTGRLVQRSRNAFFKTTENTHSIAAHWLAAAQNTGAHASGVTLSLIETVQTTASRTVVNARADFVVFDQQAADLQGVDLCGVLDQWIFATPRALIRDVMVAGRWRVQNAHHLDETRIKARYSKALARLWANA
jgi:formimidoylglutamate deiminase